MKIERFSVGGSCGGKCGGGGMALKLSQSVSTAMLAKILATGDYVEAKHLTAVNIMYVESKYLVATGAFNQNTLTLKCKFTQPPSSEECQKHITAFEEIISSLE